MSDGNLLRGSPSCPGCGSKLDCYTELTEGTVPKADDVTICIVCGVIMRFTLDDAGNYGLDRVPEEGHAELFAQQPLLLRAKLAVDELRSQRRIH